MVSTPGFAAHCVELLGALGSSRARRMFGGHGLYVDDLFVALIADDRLYLKVDAQTLEAFAQAGCEPFVYTSRGRAIALSYWSAPEAAMESPAAMQAWARLAFEAALRARGASKRLRRAAGSAPPAPVAPGATPRRRGAR